MKQSVDLISKMLNVDILDNIKNLAKEKGMDFPVHVLLQQNPFFHFLGQFYAGLRVYEQYYKKQMNPEMKEAIEKADQFMKRMISEAINDSIMKKK